MIRVLHLLILSLVVTCVSPAVAATIFESSTLGQTGIPFGDLQAGAVPNILVDSNVYAAVRFQLHQSVITSQIGGHFVGEASGTFFGAVVRLDNASDVPDSRDFSTSDFLGSTVIDFPISSGEVFGDLALSLDPGWYALVFGSGLFGATAPGASVRNGTDIGSPSFLMLQPNTPTGWTNITTLPNQRYVITGRIVPESSTVILGAIATFIMLQSRCGPRLLRDFADRLIVRRHILDALITREMFLTRTDRMPRLSR